MTGADQAAAGAAAGMSAEEREDYYQGAADNWNEAPYSPHWPAARRRGYEDAVLVAPAPAAAAEG